MKKFFLASAAFAFSIVAIFLYVESTIPKPKISLRNISSHSFDSVELHYVGAKDGKLKKAELLGELKAGEERLAPLQTNGKTALDVAVKVGASSFTIRCGAYITLGEQFSAELSESEKASTCKQVPKLP